MLAPLPVGVAGKILNHLLLELCTRLLRQAPEGVREAWLGTMAQERAELVRRKLRYPVGTAGALAAFLAGATVPGGESSGRDREGRHG